MHASLRTLFAAAVLFAVAFPSASPASESIAKQTGKACTACHDKPGSKLLTDPGKYYETLHTLAGYDTLQATFGRCTACHARKPGSKQLTRKGREFSALVKDMPALGEWLRANHPAPQGK